MKQSLQICAAFYRHWEDRVLQYITHDDVYMRRNSSSVNSRSINSSRNTNSIDLARVFQQTGIKHAAKPTTLRCALHTVFKQSHRFQANSLLAYIEVSHGAISPPKNQPFLAIPSITHRTFLFHQSNVSTKTQRSLLNPSRTPEFISVQRSTPYFPQFHQQTTFPLSLPPGNIEIRVISRSMGFDSPKNSYKYRRKDKEKERERERERERFSRFCPSVSHCWLATTPKQPGRGGYRGWLRLPPRLNPLPLSRLSV